MHGSGLPIAIGRMPALATTTSILPRSARAASTVSRSSWRSRTSAIRATTRRPSSFTDRSVSERSSGVANG